MDGALFNQNTAHFSISIYSDERIVAGNAKEFVHELRVGSWMDSDCTDEQYMHNFAERYVVQSGVRIAIDTPEKFLADLIRTGYAKEM